MKHIKRKVSKRKKKTKFFLKTSKYAFIFFIWSTIFTGLSLLWYSYDLPNIKSLEKSKRQPSVVIKARDGSIIATYGNLFEGTVLVKNLPPYVINAILAIEDSRFYKHFGVDIIGLIRAIWLNYRSGKVVQGGSTITQQLAKNFLISEKLYKSTNRSLRRKIQELILAFWLERKFDKDQILTIYLNRIYMGAGTFGIEAASRKYFGKHAKDLTVYEAATIAGLLKAPSKYSPIYNFERSYNRTKLVLNRMIELGFVTEKDINNLSVNKFKNKKNFSPYFTDWILDTIPNYAEFDQDLIVLTTLDMRLQKAAKQETKNFIDEFGKSRRIGEVALISMTPDGAIRAMIGGKDYSISKFNRAIQAYRQPGSAIKLFVYLAALEYGFTLNSKISDLPVKIGKWRPRNYNWKARGKVSLKDAFAYSINTVSVRLAYKIGIKNLSKIIKKLTLIKPKKKDLSIALGSNEITLANLTSAYATVANHGFRSSAYGITEIKNKKGKILYRHKNSNIRRVIKKSHVLSLLRMLMSVMKYGTGRKYILDRPCAGKTGTSQKHRDAWFVGFTPDLVTGVWLGNDNGKPMYKVVGGDAAKVWYEFMKNVHNGYVIRNFPFR